MGRLVVRNTIFALLLLGTISVLAFALSRMVPGDVVLDFLSIDDRAYSTSMNPADQRAAYARVARQRGLDLPAFYMSMHPGLYPDSLYRIVYRDDRASVKAWIEQSRDGMRCLQLYDQLLATLEAACRPGNAAGSPSACSHIHAILLTPDLEGVHHAIGQALAGRSAGFPAWGEPLTRAHTLAETLLRQPRRHSAGQWIPAFQWNGTANQYHRWMSGLLLARPLTSLVDGRDAWTKIGEAVRWTLLMNGLALVLALLAGMAIGTWSATHEGAWYERVTHILLFVLFALPSFWVATLLITGFSSGEWLSVFPTGGLGNYQRANGLWERWGIILWHLVLPVACMALGALAYVSRQMKTSVVHQLRQPYVGYLRTQGIGEKVILRRHVLRNALFPMITLTGNAIPGLLSGSLLMEVIFSIPGMGRLLYTSLLARDWPVAFPILMISAAVTVTAYLVTDVIYRWADPRVKTGTA